MGGTTEEEANWGNHIFELLILTTCVCKSVAWLYFGGGSLFVPRVVAPGGLEVINP